MQEKESWWLVSLEDARGEEIEPTETAVCRRLYLEEILARLTEREREAVGLLAAGVSLTEIAMALFLTEAEIENMIYRMRGRLKRLGYSINF